MGAPVGKNLNGWEVSVDKFDLTELGSKLMAGKRSLVRSLLILDPLKAGC